MLRCLDFAHHSLELVCTTLFGLSLREAFTVPRRYARNESHKKQQSNNINLKRIGSRCIPFETSTVVVPYQFYMDSSQNNQFRTGEDWPRNPTPSQYGSTFPTAPESYPWNNVTADYSHAFDYENQAPTFPNNSAAQLPVESHQANAAFPTPPQPALFNSFGTNTDGNFALPSATRVASNAPLHGDLAQLQAPKERQSTRRTRYGPADWKVHRPQIKKLYIDEDRSLEYTMNIMSESFGFHPS